MAGYRHACVATRLALIALGLVIALGRPTATSSASEAKGFLAATFSLGADELERIAAGEVVTRTLIPSDSREVATVGIVRMRMTPDFYVSRLADIVNFKRDEAVLQIGVFELSACSRGHRVADPRPRRRSQSPRVSGGSLRHAAPCRRHRPLPAGSELAALRRS